MTKPLVFQLVPAENRRLSALCGQLNCHIKQIERHLGVKIIARANAFSVSGAQRRIECAERVLRELFDMTAEAETNLTSNDVHLALSRHGVAQTFNESPNLNMGNEGKKMSPTDESRAAHELMGESDKSEAHREEVVIRLRKQLIRGQNPRQKQYLRRIQDNDINFGIGPAGTGKTYLAVASAVQALSENSVERILLVRPAVEAGEKLGFLPGDIGQKIDPYLRPLFDALYEMLGFERVGKLIARGTIELAPLAYMRGRTLNEAFVILDEAQNTTTEQMKMFLTRIGFGSKAIITGDVTQVDLPRGQRSGLRHASQVLENINGISFSRFHPQDVVRHPLVQKIVEAYENKEEEKRSPEQNLSG